MFSNKTKGGGICFGQKVIDGMYQSTQPQTSGYALGSVYNISCINMVATSQFGPCTADGLSIIVTFVLHNANHRLSFIIKMCTKCDGAFVVADKAKGAKRCYHVEVAIPRKPGG